MRYWDISTGLCNATFQTPAKGHNWSGVQQVNCRLIIYYGDQGEKLYIWDVEKGELLQTVPLGEDGGDIEDIKISEDGSRVVCLYAKFVRAWSIQTGEVVGEVVFENSTCSAFLTMDGSVVWVHSLWSEPLGWDFGIPGPPPVQDIKALDIIQESRIKDPVTGKVVFRLVGRFAYPIYARCNNQYLVAGYRSGEVLILDFKHMLSR